MTGWRLVIVTKSARSMLAKDRGSVALGWQQLHGSGDSAAVAIAHSGDSGNSGNSVAVTVALVRCYQWECIIALPRRQYGNRAVAIAR